MLAGDISIRNISDCAKHLKGSLEAFVDVLRLPLHENLCLPDWENYGDAGLKSIYMPSIPAPDNTIRERQKAEDTVDCVIETGHGTGNVTSHLSTTKFLLLLYVTWLPLLKYCTYTFVQSRTYKTKSHRKSMKHMFHSQMLLRRVCERAWLGVGHLCFLKERFLYP